MRGFVDDDMPVSGVPESKMGTQVLKEGEKAEQAPAPAEPAPAASVEDRVLDPTAETAPRAQPEPLPVEVPPESSAEQDTPPPPGGPESAPPTEDAEAGKVVPLFPASGQAPNPRNILSQAGVQIPGEAAPPSSEPAASAPDQPGPGAPAAIRDEVVDHSAEAAVVPAPPLAPGDGEASSKAFRDSRAAAAAEAARVAEMTPEEQREKEEREKMAAAGARVGALASLLAGLGGRKSPGARLVSPEAAANAAAAREGFRSAIGVRQLADAQVYFSQAERHYDDAVRHSRAALEAARRHPEWAAFDGLREARVKELRLAAPGMSLAEAESRFLDEVHGAAPENPVSKQARHHLEAIASDPSVEASNRAALAASDGFARNMREGQETMRAGFSNLDNSPVAQQEMARFQTFADEMAGKPPATNLLFQKPGSMDTERRKMLEEFSENMRESLREMQERMAEALRGLTEALRGMFGKAAP